MYDMQQHKAEVDKHALRYAKRVHRTKYFAASVTIGDGVKQPDVNGHRGIIRLAINRLSL